MTLRQNLALEFVFAYLAISARYGRSAWKDFRVRAARRRYRAVIDCIRR